MTKPPRFPRPLIVSPGWLAGWISRNWKLSKADRIRLEMTAIHDDDGAIMIMIDRLWAEYRGTPKVPK
jgi:hypothetical protein